MTESILERVDARWVDALKRALVRAGIDPARAPEFKLTHDSQLVYAPDAPLPAGASGFVQCRLYDYTRPGSGAYSTWLEPGDRERSKADAERVEREAKAFRTKAQAETALRAIGCEYPDATLRGMRTQYQVRRMRQLWPMRENLPAKGRVLGITGGVL